MGNAQLNPNYRFFKSFKTVKKLIKDLQNLTEKKPWVKYQELVVTETIQAENLDGNEHTITVQLGEEFDEIKSFIVSTICVTPLHSVSTNVVFDRITTQFETADSFGNRLRIKYKSKTDLGIEYAQLMFIVSKFVD